MAIPGTRDDWLSFLAARGREIGTGIAFSTRLPLARIVPAESADTAKADLAQAIWALPLAGLVVGGVGAIVYAVAHRLGVPAWPAAALSHRRDARGDRLPARRRARRYRRRLRRRRDPRAQARDHARQPHRRLRRLRARGLDPDPRRRARKPRRSGMGGVGAARRARRRARDAAGADVLRSRRRGPTACRSPPASRRASRRSPARYSAFSFF